MEKKNNSFMIGMSVIGSIFFIFGFATTFIITLSAKVKVIFELTEFEAQLLNFSFFITYAFISIPIGLYIKKIGYKRALIIGLLLMAVGSFLFFPAASIPSFGLFLISTFVLATGVVFLQTAANPYVAALGPESTASGRLNLTQALNSIATMAAPYLISLFIFKGASEMLSAESAQTVQMPFVIMGVIIVLIALAITAIKLPEISGGDTTERKSVWKYPHVLLGALAIFMYVGAEVGNAGLLVNYLKETNSMTAETASIYAAIYWGGAMIGRFFGSFMFSEMPSSKKIMYAFPVLVLAFVSGSFVTDWNWAIGGTFLGIAAANFVIMQLGRGKAAMSLAIFTLVAAGLDIVTTFTTGRVALWTVISIGLFNSIMFPNIFTLAVKDLDQGELSTASGIINTLIFGGAIIPLIMGKVADSAGYTWAFLVPAICYLYIFFFAVKGSRIRRI
ncbi:Predicted mannose transporter, GGP family [hydrothermal vent metagenome]|uniref:Predicted mannose transporter, GGP family n=1 Tax=hydrothermal vent metagenome TaxID=652676 RepID=A0A3B0U180_9ZZZZ